MPILNYTTSVSVDKSAQEIQKRLVAHKASHIMSEYDEAGLLSHIAFRINTPQGVLSYKLPANVDGVYGVLFPKGKETMERRAQAARVAWRIVKDWIEAQLAIVQANMATTSQVFLPYAVTRDGSTVYEQFERGGMPMLLTDERSQ